MTVDTSIRGRLERLLAAGTLRGSASAAGSDLLARLDAPARVVLFGLPGAGKTRVFNDLAGESILPGTPALPTTLLRFGGVLSASAVLPDGTERHWSGHPIAEIAEACPALVTLEAPLPVLRSISLLRIDAEATIEDQAAAMAWAARQCDIAVWCSSGYNAKEAHIWSLAPEQLKHDAFLAHSGPTPRTDDFIAEFDVSSGTSELLAEVKNVVGGARAAYLDHALLFLARYAPEEVDPARSGPPRSRPLTARLPKGEAPKSEADLVEAPGAPQAAPDAPAVEVSPIAAETRRGRTDDRTVSRPLTRSGAHPVSRPVSRVLKPRQAPPQAADGTTPLIPRRAQRQAPLPVGRVCFDAATILRDRARDLSNVLPTYGKKPADRVFAHCLETIQVLATTLSAAGSSELSDLVMDVMDAITLLKSEGGTEQAADSVTLLLQLRRDLEARQAA